MRKENLYGKSIRLKNTDVYIADIETYLSECSKYTRYAENHILYTDTSKYDDLHRAINNNNIEELLMIIKNGYDLNSKNDISDIIPLSLAIYNNNIEIVRILIEAGAKDINGCISIATSRNNLDMIKVLLEYGFDINKKNEGKNAWHRALESNAKVIYNNIDVERKVLLDFLAKNGIDVFAKTDDLYNMFHITAQLGLYENFIDSIECIKKHHKAKTDIGIYFNEEIELRNIYTDMIHEVTNKKQNMMHLITLSDNVDFYCYFDECISRTVRNIAKRIVIEDENSYQYVENDTDAMAVMPFNKFDLGVFDRDIYGNKYDDYAKLIKTCKYIKLTKAGRNKVFKIENDTIYMPKDSFIVDKIIETCYYSEKVHGELELTK